MPEMTLDEYANQLFGREDEVLGQLAAEAQREGVPSIQMQPELARMASVLVAAARARDILEIGTLFGYGAITLARAAGEAGRVTTLEVSPKHADIAEANIERVSLGERIQVVRGPAVESLGRLPDHSFDFIFIDADKSGYRAYLEHALRLVRPGGIIVADNIWRGGAVLDDGAGDDARGAAEFNRRLAQEPGLVSAFVPTLGGADGFSVSVVRQ